jgi:hypothetical protein
MRLGAVARGALRQQQSGAIAAPQRAELEAARILTGATLVR